jgi:hypothetical protein
MFRLRLRPRFGGVAAIELAGFGPEGVHGGGQLALGD